jgi:hypothetical protein
MIRFLQRLFLFMRREKPDEAAIAALMALAEQREIKWDKPAASPSLPPETNHAKT